MSFASFLNINFFYEDVYYILNVYFTKYIYPVCDQKCLYFGESYYLLSKCGIYLINFTRHSNKLMQLHR